MVDKKHERDGGLLSERQVRKNRNKVWSDGR